MPVTIRKGLMKYRGPNGTYQAIDAVGQEDAEHQIAAIRAAGEEQLNSISSALQEAKDSGEFDGPQGPKGDQGLPGPKGDKGDPGDLQLDATLTSSSAAAPADKVGQLRSAVNTLENTESDYTVRGSFANLIYETLGLFVDNNGDICQREEAV